MSSQTGRIKTTKKGESNDSDEASTWRTALSISSGSYSGLVIQEPVQLKRKEFISAPKVSSSEKAEQYVIPPVMEQFRGLLKSSVVVRNIISNACWSEDGVA